MQRRHFHFVYSSIRVIADSPTGSKEGRGFEAGRLHVIGCFRGKGERGTFPKLPGSGKEAVRSRAVAREEVWGFKPFPKSFRGSA